MQVVWFAEIKWDYLRTRKQQLVRRRPSDIDVVFLEPWVRGRENRLALRETDGIRVATVPFIKSAPGGVARALLDRRAVRAMVDAGARLRVASLLARAGVPPRASVAVISNVYAVHAARSLHARALVYDCNDAHAEFPGSPAWTRGYQRECFRSAQRVVVSSQGLLAGAVAARGGVAGVQLIGNGVDLDVFRAPPVPRVPAARPRVGYLGAIAPWMDFDLVSSVARAHPGWDIELVGPVLGDARHDLAALLTLANVTHRGAVPHDDVPHVLHGFDVGIIPFRLTPLTAGVNPNKLYEYLAAGLPVVTTPFSPDVAACEGVVALASGPDDFARACGALTGARRDAGTRARQVERAAAVAAGHGWEAIAREFWACVRDAAERA